MPPIESFLTNLLEMRSHYQARVNQCDRLIAYAQDGLSHVNALLVDEVLDNQQFATNLLQMRSYYQATIDKQKRQLASAKEQLHHINALLAEQMAMQHRGEQAISMQATAIANNPVLTEGIDDKKLPLVDPIEAEPTDAQQQGEVAAETASQQPSLELELNSPITPQGDRVEQVSQPLEQLPLVESNGSKASQIKTPLLPQYQHLTRSEAVEKLLQENIGTILHTDYIVRSLYGNLEKEAFKVEKQRLYETLGKGIAKGLWDKIPDQPGCYTIDLKLVDKEEKSSPTSHQQAAKLESDGRIEVLPAYQHLNFTQAVEMVLRENPGQVMNSEKVARILYGDLDAKKLSKAKDKVGKVLWAGARQKRWQPVRGKLGAYTLTTE